MIVTLRNQPPFRSISNIKHTVQEMPKQNSVRTVNRRCSEGFLRVYRNQLKTAIVRGKLRHTSQSQAQANIKAQHPKDQSP